MPSAGMPSEGLLEEPPGDALPDLPAVSPPEAVVLPPVNAPVVPQVAARESRMTLMSPAGVEQEDETDWMVVIGIALVAEIGLLWGVACLGLLRRRLVLHRAVSGS
ncbi:hypothetical protein [Actinomadura chokoriensis]|uniref:Uncharacterized protein n=1 Tax=Actinomadura chokoriensis TaxID=454156 RepID=A0ABV4QT85_9ACTN